MRRFVFIVWLMMMAAISPVSVEAAQPEIPTLLPTLHPWGKFEPGAWKRIRVVTEAFNEQGTVASTSITDSQTTLFDLESESLTLETNACVEMSGKQFETEPQMVKQGFHGEVLSPTLKIKDETSGEMEIEDRKIPCRILKLESTNGTSKTSTVIYYSPSQSPNILKREVKTTDLEGKNILSETTATLLTFNLPYRILGENRSVSHIKTVQKSPKGTIVTMAVFCPEIPGGIVSHSSKELDPSGRPVRKSTLELVDFSTDPEKDRSNVFGRKRSNRRSH